MKRNDARIYIIAHKPVDYGIWDNALYTPVQVGYGERFLENRDDECPGSISTLNNYYAETTGLYWAWKTHPRDAKYIGVCQYRRRLEFPEDQDFDELFGGVGVIAAEPLPFPVYLQYCMCHSRKDVEEAGEIICELFPEYEESFGKYILNGRKLYYSNGFVMRAEDFDRYCEWLFQILGEIRRRRGWNTPERVEADITAEIAEGKRNPSKSVGYQSQVGGFLSERLLTLFILHNFKDNEIMHVPYHKYEGV